MAWIKSLATVIECFVFIVGVGFLMVSGPIWLWFAISMMVIISLVRYSLYEDE